METSKQPGEGEQMKRRVQAAQQRPSAEELHELRRKSWTQRFGSSETVLGSQGGVIVRRKAAEHYTNGKEASERRQYERAVICFSKSITLQPEQAQLYVSQAESFLQLCDFQSAALCYRRASARESGAFGGRLAFIYYLQGQCLFDRGLYLDALQAFSRAAELRPLCRACAARSLACLAAAGYVADCLRPLNDWITSDASNPDLYVLRARLHKQLNQIWQCHRDVSSALALNPACPEAAALLRQLRDAGEDARQKAADRALAGRLPEALCMANVALENRPRDARLYLFRGILYRRLKDFTAAIEDLVRAVELGEDEAGEAVRGQEGGGDQREGGGDQREGGGDQREGGGDQRHEGGDQREGGGVQREGGRDQRHEGGDQREGGGVQREGGGVQREGGGDQNHEGGDQREGGGVQREGGGVQREGGGSLRTEVQFQLVLTYNDFAVQCFSRGLYAEAALLLNKAIDEEKGQAGLYLNRGDCFFKQAQWCYALADYQQAEEMQPDDPAVRLRLAVLHSTLGSLCFQDGHFHEAASMFSAAIHYNPAASRCYENRSKAFRKVLNWDGAKQDLIRALILDPAGEELPAMLMSLFPGSSMSDVLSSPAAQTLRAQLMETVRAFNCISEQHRLSEQLQQLSVADQGAAEQLRLWGDQQQMRRVQSFLQVKEAPPSFVRDHPGPATPEAGRRSTPPTSTGVTLGFQ